METDSRESITILQPKVAFGVVEHNIPLPSSGNPHRNHRWQPLASQMKDGDSVVLPLMDANAFGAYLRYKGFRVSIQSLGNLATLPKVQYYSRVWMRGRKEEAKGEATYQCTCGKSYLHRGSIARHLDSHSRFGGHQEIPRPLPAGCGVVPIHKNKVLCVCGKPWMHAGFCGDKTESGTSSVGSLETTPDAKDDSLPPELRGRGLQRGKLTHPAGP